MHKDNLTVVSHYPTDLQASQTMLQCSNRVRGRDCKLVDMDVNNPVFRKAKVDFMGKKIHVTCALDFKDTRTQWCLVRTTCKQ